jgi:hypothetical protein
MDWIKKKLKEHSEQQHHHSSSRARSSSEAPPDWAPAPEVSHTDGLYADASTDSYRAGIDFCNRYAVQVCPRVPTRPPPHSISRDSYERVDDLTDGITMCVHCVLSAASPPGFGPRRTYRS